MLIFIFHSNMEFHGSYYKYFLFSISLSYVSHLLGEKIEKSRVILKEIFVVVYE